MEMVYLLIITILNLPILVYLVFVSNKNKIAQVIEPILTLIQGELKENRSELSVSLKQNREEQTNDMYRLTKNWKINFC